MKLFFDARGTQQNRILVYPLLIQIGFPEFVTAQVALNAYAPVLLDAFIISQIYSLDTKKATIIFNTVIGFPFNLVLGIPNIAISLTEVTGFAANVNNNVPNALATIAGTQSKQTWILEITPPAPACTFTGNYNITGFVIVCVDPQNDCPTINNNQVAVNLVIESENFCAQTSAVVGVVPTLTAYSDSAFQNPGVNFLVDDIPVQSAYFDMTVTSTAVTISGITITTIRISSSSSILFAPGGTPTTAVTIFNNGTWINGINGLVGIQSLVPGSARFKFDMVSALFNIPVDTAAQIVVQVTSSVRYLGGKKRSIASDNRLDDRRRSYEEEFVTEYVVDLADGQQPEVYSLALGIKGPKGKAEVSPNVPSGAMGLNMNLVFVGLLALTAFIAVSVFIVLVVVLVRNRKQSDDKKEYERAVNNDDLVASEMQSLDEISI